MQIVSIKKPTFKFGGRQSTQVCVEKVEKQQFDQGPGTETEEVNNNRNINKQGTFHDIFLLKNLGQK